MWATGQISIPAKKPGLPATGTERGSHYRGQTCVNVTGRYAHHFNHWLGVAQSGARSLAHVVQKSRLPALDAARYLKRGVAGQQAPWPHGKAWYAPLNIPLRSQ